MIGAPVGIHREVRGLGALQPHRRTEHGSGQPHPADGGPEQLLGLAVGSQGAHLAVGHQQVEDCDVVAEAALGVVVLAVHVGGDRAADGHLPGARQHRHPEAERQQRPHQRVETDPGLDGHRGRFGGGVDRQDLVQLGQVEGRAAGVLGGVAVAAAEPPGHHAAVVGGAQGRDGIGDRVDLGQVGHAAGGPAPAVQFDQRLRNHRLLLRHRWPDMREDFQLAHRTPPPRSPRSTPPQFLAGPDRAARPPPVRRRCRRRPRAHTATGPR